MEPIERLIQELKGNIQWRADNEQKLGNMPRWLSLSEKTQKSIASMQSESDELVKAHKTLSAKYDRLRRYIIAIGESESVALSISDQFYNTRNVFQQVKYWNNPYLLFEDAMEYNYEIAKVSVFNNLIFEYEEYRHINGVSRRSAKSN